MPCAIDPDERVKRSRFAVGLLALLGLMAVTTASTQTINGVTSLSFGSFLAGSGGTVVVSPAGLRTSTGGVLGVNQASAAAAAQFTVVGTAGATYSITLPANGTVELSDGNGNVMALNSFVSSPASAGTLSGGGSQAIRIGATLVVRPNQPPGSYAGAFNVTVNY
jgi:hypothetical protein